MSPIYLEHKYICNKFINDALSHTVKAEFFLTTLFLVLQLLFFLFFVFFQEWKISDLDLFLFVLFLQQLTRVCHKNLTTSYFPLCKNRVQHVKLTLQAFAQHKAVIFCSHVAIDWHQ